MRFFKKLGRYAAMATGDFERLFKDFEVPACPRVVTELLKATKDPEVTIDKVASILEMDPGLGSKLLRLVNSSLYGLPGTVSSISRAVNLVGMKEVENLAVCYAVSKSLKDPKIKGFDLNKFILHSFFRAIFARELAKILDVEAEDAFTGGLMQDIAIPTLLTEWYDIYKKAFEEHLETGEPLHQVETRHFSWNHCEGGAWIAKSWEFPDILVCSIGLHAKSVEELDEMGLTKTAIGPVALSSRVPQPWLEDTDDGLEGLKTEAEKYGISASRLQECIAHSKEVLEEIGPILQG